MRTRLPYAILIFSLICLFSIGLFLLRPKSCSESYRTDLSIKVNGHTLLAQKAYSEQDRERGLSGRSCIVPNRAMLFSFDKPGNYPFWMKGMKFSIDIIWISKDHKVVELKRNLKPSSYPQTFINETSAQDVLELGSGQAEALGIATGTQLYY